MAEEIYHSDASGHGADHAQAYIIEVEDPSSQVAVVEEKEDINLFLATANIDKGAKVFGKCKACHKLEDGANGTGPHLYAVVDRAVGSVEGYGYSGALVAVAETWSPENLDGFLENPKKYAPGTKMGFAGLKSEKDRSSVILYLNQNSDNPKPLP